VIVLDASVLIGHFEPADAHHTEATALLRSRLTQPFVASVITLAEVYTGAARAGQSDRLRRLVAQLQIESVGLPGNAALRLGELRALTNLKMPDCCVLYTAEQRSAAIATFDDILAARASDLGLTIATN
jgi:predicted nucleic acid-binding protein